MPESKHRRKNKTRPRPRNVAGPKKNPEPSPPWVPVVGVSLLVAGVLVILLGYLPVVQEITANWTWLGLGQNWTLVIGFIMLTAGFGFLTRWQ